VNLDVQAGTGSIDPLVGVAYGAFFHPWLFYASSTLLVPTTGWEGMRAGRSLRTSASAQLQPWPSVAFQLGIDTRLDEVSHRMGAVEPDSGGFIAFVTPRVVYSAVTDLLLQASVAVPALNRLDGHHVEGPIFSIGAMYDF
jgi:hypothetical protein